MEIVKNTSKKNIGLFLMTKKGRDVLAQLLDCNYVNFISLVVVGRDGALQNDFADEIIDLCKKNNIAYQERDAEISVSLGYCLMISWRWLVNIEFAKVVVLHDSLLPRYRGFSPLVNALINGEKKIGVTALLATKDFDCGDIISQCSVDISYPILIAEAVEKISPLYGELAKQIFKTIVEGGNLIGSPQNSAEATYSLWRDENDYIIDWQKDSQRILREIHALSFPYQGAMCYLGDKKLIILGAEIFPDVVIENRDVGKCIFKVDGFPVIVCGEGLLKITQACWAATKESYGFEKFRIRLSSQPTV
jgi:methionyl-tRNA formyltransferase